MKNNVFICPTCGTKIVEYKHSINKTLVSCLHRLNALGGRARLDKMQLDNTQFANFQKLRYFGLAVPTNEHNELLAFLNNIKLTKEEMIDISKEAENLYVGIVTDTGRFQQLNTNANSHLVVAELLKLGVNSNKLCKKLFLTMEISKMRLYGFALSNIETAYNDKLVYIKLTKEMFNKAKASDTDTDGIINYCISAPKAVVGCLLKEADKNSTKLSFRSI